MTKYKVEFEVEADSADHVIAELSGGLNGISKLSIEEAKPDKYRTFGEVALTVDDSAVAKAVARGGYVQGGQVQKATLEPGERVTKLPTVDTSYYGPYGYGSRFGVD